MLPRDGRGRGVALAAALALLASSIAPTIAPGADASNHGEGSDWQVRTLVDATVEDNYATVDVTARITEGGPDPEFPFVVRVPDDAYVTGLTITRNGTTHEAEIRPDEAARVSYEEHQARNGTAGLVEARDRNTYRYLVNVEEATSVTATLTYVTYLEASNGTYTLPLEAPVSGFGQDRGAAFDVTLRHRNGIRDAWGTPTADVREENGTLTFRRSVGPREGEAATPFNASYTLEETPDGGSLLAVERNDTGYFAHRFRASPQARELPVDMALALDTSGSMSGLKIDQLRDAARSLVAGLDGRDRLQLVPFDGAVRPVWPGLRPADPANRSEALQAVDRFAASGSTNIEGALSESFAGYEGLPARSNASGVETLVVLTDGRPTRGEEDVDVLRAQARAANDGSTRVFGLAFGEDADWSLIHGLAEDGNGTALRVPAGAGAEVDLARFMRSLTAPVLRDVSVSYDGPVDAFHPSAPVLFAGSELLVVGTYEPGIGNVTGTVEAQGPDGPLEHRFSHPASGDDDAGFLPDLVAYHQVRALEDRIDAVGPRSDLVERVRNLSLEHGFVTDHTSLVVTLPKENETRELCRDCPTETSSPEEHAARMPDAGGSPGGGSQGGGGAPSDSGTAPGGGSQGGSDPAADRSVRDSDGADPDAGGAGTPDHGTSDPGSGGTDGSSGPYGGATPPEDRQGSRDRPGSVPGPGAVAAMGAALAAGLARRRR